MTKEEARVEVTKKLAHIEEMLPSIQAHPSYMSSKVVASLKELLDILITEMQKMETHGANDLALLARASRLRSKLDGGTHLHLVH